MRNMSNMDLLKGLGIGLALGGLIGLSLTSGKRKRKKCKNHTIKAIGEVVDNVTDMLGM